MKIKDITVKNAGDTLIVPDEWIEIEFVCVNRDYPDSTSPEQQLALFDALKSVPDIIAYIQDFNEDEYMQDAGKSLAVLAKDDDVIQKVKEIAARHKVEVDLIQKRSESFVSSVLNDPTVVDWFETFDDSVLDEMALPVNWDETELSHDKTFKSRLKYALQHAKKIGSGSSRIALVVPDSGHDTVLKIAKNKKGIAQNKAEVDVLADPYVQSLGITIPLIDYDQSNPTPIWLQTARAEKVKLRELEQLLQCKPAEQLRHRKVNSGLDYVTAKLKIMNGESVHILMKEQNIEEDLKKGGNNVAAFNAYVEKIHDLIEHTNIERFDLNMAENWGKYDDKPVIIDAGLNQHVWSNFYMKESSMKAQELEEANQYKVLGNLCTVKTNFPDADFYLQRSGTLGNVGKPSLDYSPDAIGVKVEDTEVLLPKFLYYYMMNVHNQGYWKDKAVGSVKLQHIRTADVYNFPIVLKMTEDIQSGRYHLLTEAYRQVNEEIDIGKVLDLTPNFQNYEKLHAKVIAINPKKKLTKLQVIADELKPGMRESDMIKNGKTNGFFVLKTHFIRNVKTLN